MELERFADYKALRREVRQLRRQLSSVEALIYSPRGQRFSSTPHASDGKGHNMDDLIIGHLALKETIDAKVLELTRELTELELAVETLENPLERAVMRYRYFEGYSWNRISETLHYSKPQLYRYHDKAREHLANWRYEIENEDPED